MSDYSEYFEELRDVTSKPLIMSNNNANFCFFGRFSIPTYAHHMSGMLFVEYDTNYDDHRAKTAVRHEYSLDTGLTQKISYHNIRIRDSNSRQCIGKPVTIDCKNYIVIIDKGSYFEVKPLKGMLIFHPDVRSKHNSNSDIAEIIKRDYIVRDAAIIAKIHESKLQTKVEVDVEEADDYEERLSMRASGPKKSNLKPNAISRRIEDRLDDIYDQDFGLKKQEKKRRLAALASKSEKKVDDLRVIESALSLTTLKKSNINWDYDGDGQMSDDDEYIDGNEANIDSNKEDMNIPDNGSIDSLDSEEEDGPDEILTEYGQTLKTMIANQQDMEADDELNAYSDEVEDDAESRSNVSGTAPITAGIPTNVKILTQDSQQKFTTRSPTVSSVISSATYGNTRNLESEVIRKLSLAGGRMQIKAFLDAMKVKKKNKYFEDIQEVIKKVADTHTEYHGNTKMSYITLRTNYRQR
ncbi:hypothetical protein cand_036600 [Cryptosporidium andersoni]|uniref:Transcription initiation factor IIF subunit alpha n=1 Tax=Cryptosporidium andersoni TaxID=117008 RepID=A0A1J4MY68_9CRYT|nr:hypothetical protein cand_036600 [Cryptosporidium andersoni]